MSKKILKIKTDKIFAIKHLFDKISHVTSECNIVFMKKTKKSSGGMRIFEITERNAVIIKISFEADKFQYFRCDKETLTVGIDIGNFVKKTKILSQNSAVMIYMLENNNNILYIKSNEENNECEISINLVEHKSRTIEIPANDIPLIFNINPNELHNICKNINSNSHFIELEINNNKLFFKGEDDGGKILMKRFLESKNKKINKESFTQGKYDIKYLVNFSNFGAVCGSLDIYIKKDYPLILSIPISELGELFVYICPVQSTNNK